MGIRVYFVIVLILLAGLTSCEQPETPMSLPKAVGKKFSYEMGNDYSNQIYVDLESGFVNSVKVNCWDLAFACDPTLNKDWYEFALELDKPCIGIDIDNKTIARLPISRQFEVREKHMVEMIKDYMITGKVVVVVGDTHLRTIKTNELGEISLLQKEFKDVAKIIRSRFSEIK